jgi:hypothetical protein
MGPLHVYEYVILTGGIAYFKIFNKFARDCVWEGTKKIVD